MNNEQIDWPADLVTYSERAAYLRGLQASKPGVRVCCQDYEKCREMCVPRADYWQGQASQLTRAALTTQAPAEPATTDDELMEESAADIVDPAYWRGHDASCAGVAGRWEEALTEPIPKPGMMNEPFESLYRRTEALRTAAPTPVEPGNAAKGD